MHCKKKYEQYSGNKAVGVQQSDQPAFVAELQIDEIVAHRNSFEDVAEGDAEKKCRQKAGDDDCHIP